jgi:hypothetical protein
MREALVYCQEKCEKNRRFSFFGLFMNKWYDLSENKQEIPCTTEARSTFFGYTGSNSRFLAVFIISMKFSIIIFGIWDFGRIRE